MSRRWSKCWGCEPAARPRATVSVCFTTPGLGRRHPDGGQEPLHAAIEARRSGHVAVMRQTPREWIPTSAGKTMGIRSRCVCGSYFASGSRHDRDIAPALRSRWATPDPSALEGSEVRTAKPAGEPCRARRSMISAPPPARDERPDQGTERSNAPGQPTASFASKSREADTEAPETERPARPFPGRAGRRKPILRDQAISRSGRSRNRGCGCSAGARTARRSGGTRSCDRGT